MLHYPMAVRTVVSVEDIVGALATLLGTDPVDGRITIGALSVDIDVPDHPVTRSVLDDLLTAPGTCFVDWWIEDKGDAADYERARLLLARAAPALARELDAEACLTFQLDLALMRRRDGALELFSWFRPWGIAEVQESLEDPWTLVQDDGRL